MKKFLIFCLSAVLLASACLGCASQQNTDSVTGDRALSESTSIDLNGQTVTMKITSVNGNTVTAEVGAIMEASQPNGMQPGNPSMPPPSMPTDNSSESDVSTSGNMTSPEKPNGEMPGGNPPSMNGMGQPGEGMTPPDMPNGNGNGMGNPPANPDNDSSGSSSESTDSNDSVIPEQTVDPKAEFIPFVSSGLTLTFDVSDTTQYAKGDTAISASDITAGSIVTVTFGPSNTVSSVSVYEPSIPSSFGDNGSQDNGSAATEITEDSVLSGETYTSTGDNENALRVTDAAVTMDSVTIDKSAGATSNTENGDFYGTNAAFLAQDGANVTISNATVSSSAQNGNGIFSYGTGTTVSVADSTVHTENDNSGGIHVTGGATLNATNLTVETNGNSSAAIRSDRGGGNMTVDSGSYTSNGTGSPAIYSVANIYVTNAKLSATNSEALVIEGKNSITLLNCDVTGNMSGTYKDENENIHNIMIYQSMSGDAEVGQATFSAEGGSITAKQGDMIYITNTSCTISLSDVILKLANDTLLRIEGNNSSRGWGIQGSNGGTCDFTAKNQDLVGNIIVDEISKLSMNLSEGSTFEGTINASGNAGTVNVTLDESSTWKLTGDSYITSLNCNADQIDLNGYTLYVNGEAYAS